MTWIAACSGQRGTYQEVVMIDKTGLQYLRNINTKPGPNAGRSIDPTKPGPDDGLNPIPMTNEERQGLCKDLREASDMHVTHWVRIKAADELERLAAELDAMMWDANTQYGLQEKMERLAAEARRNATEDRDS